MVGLPLGPADGSRRGRRIRTVETRSGTDRDQILEPDDRILMASAFRGQTPDEMYFGTGRDIPKQLEALTGLKKQASPELLTLVGTGRHSLLRRRP